MDITLNDSTLERLQLIASKNYRTADAEIKFMLDRCYTTAGTLKKARVARKNTGKRSKKEPTERPVGVSLLPDKDTQNEFPFPKEGSIRHQLMVVAFEIYSMGGGKSWFHTNTLLNRYKQRVGSKCDITAKDVSSQISQLVDRGWMIVNADTMPRAYTLSDNAVALMSVETKAAMGQ